MKFTCFALFTFLALFCKVHEVKGQAPPHKRMREFWECVSCNSNNLARTDFDLCLSRLTMETKMVLIKCCKSTYGPQFCQQVAVGKTDYGTICANPSHGVSVERCFWNERNKNQADIAKFKTCKREILSKYCTVL